MRGRNYAHADIVGLNRLESILAAVTDGISALDAGLRFTYLNDEALKVMAEALVARQRAIDPRHEIVVQLDEAPDQLPGDVSIHLLRSPARP